MSLFIAAIFTILCVAIFAALAFGPQHDPASEEAERDRRNNLKNHPKRVWEDES